MPTAIVTETPTPTSPSTTHRRASLKVLSRNIDKVALGNLVFPTWYYSPYPDSIIHENDFRNVTNSHAAVGSRELEIEDNHGYQSESGPTKQDRKAVTSHSKHVTDINGISKHPVSSAIATAHANQGHPHAPNSISSFSSSTEKSVLSTLHVCPYCFRYTASLTDYLGHLTLHVKTETEYYATRKSSLRSRQRIRANRPASSFSKQGHNSDNDEKHDDDQGGQSDGDEDDPDAPRPVPNTAIKVYSHKGYTVWDVDGEVEKLYCQNLSLFGKLFLEQKSVFFDTAGFHYFVLTYCDPHRRRHAQDTSPSSPVSPRHKTTSKLTPTSSPTSTRRRKASLSAAEATAASHPSSPTLNDPRLPLRHQVLGFFSKENLSWDSNNLACILVFPPYQHRNLGQLLMAVSYKLSGWEWEGSIIGGPEKPLSSMGRKSYLRFWSERIARFVMGQSQDAEGLKAFEEPVTRRIRRRGSDSNDKGSDDDDGDESNDDDVAVIVTGKKRKRQRGKGFVREELSVKELGDRTGMLGEDVVAALVEMGVCDLVAPKRKKPQPSKTQKGGSDGGVNHNSTIASTGSGSRAAAVFNTTTTNAVTVPTPGGDNDDSDPSLTTMIVQRSRILEWVTRSKVDLVSPVREEGFLGEWAMSEEEEEEEEEEDEDEDDEDESESQQSSSSSSGDGDDGDNGGDE